ncbi:hypothetical protein BJY04DRAFT_206955 [Aspergillus karnatakaensis]|uniref:uncharacterized protein n=1 Tax=Aspergillus karnatakaensis TaxID=1810916 RepID=UPI003CCCED62
MVSRRHNIGASRRRRRDDEGEDEGSLDGELEDDSLSEGSVISQQDEDDADGEGSEESEDDNVSIDNPDKHQTNGRSSHSPRRRQSASPKKATLATTMSDTETMLNGLKISGDGKGLPEMHFDDMREELGQTRRTPSAPPTEGMRESFTERKRVDNEKPVKGKGEDPTAVPTRGSFFLHDKRSTESATNGHKPFSKSKSRPYGLIVDGNVRRKQDVTTEGPWTHDLHDTVAGDDRPLPRRPPPSVAASTYAQKNIPTTVPTAPTTSPVNRNFSTTITTGKMLLVVYIPGMKNPVTCPAVDKKHYTNLPEHRPPLRRDKPVRISLPGQTPRYIFPATERSFIFIPRAMRPNQHNYRGRGRGGFYGGRRPSFYASSTYTPSVALSRRSSFGKPPSQDGYHSPAASVISRHTVVTTENGKPVVRLPPPRLPGAIVPPVAPPIPLAPTYPAQSQPQQPIWRESRPAPIPMHQPRPQKAVSLADIETPASFPANPPPAQDQPFHHQVPVPGTHVGLGHVIYNADAPTHYPPPAHTAATPLSQIPERAVHAPPFQAYGFQQPQSYYPSPYQPGPVYYPGTDYAPYNGVGTASGASYPAGQNAPYMVPGTHTPAEPPSQAGTVAHESGGTVYFYDASQMYTGSSFGGTPVGGAAGMGGMMTPRHFIMSAPTPAPVGPGTLITVKVTYDNHTRRFKIPLRELGARTLPQNLRQLLGIPADTNVIFERYSDSAGSFVQLDSNNPAVFKQLYRAAKAKLKLRIKATVDQPENQTAELETPSEQQEPPRYSYLDTVLSPPIPAKVLDTGASATTSSTALPESAERETLTALDSLWASTKKEEKQTASLREFVLGPDNPITPVLSHTSVAGVFCIDCNHCGRAIPNEHYHCNTCSDGDYDLCPECIDSGVNCLGEDHWLVRRFVQDGIITNSTTKTLASHKIHNQEEELQPKPVLETASEPFEKPVADAERICNNCLQEFEEGKMVSCADCEDFDLCITCVLGHKHGHHPSHTFVLLGEHDSGLKNLVLSRCKPGRGYHHAAICDGCDNHITGVRHKCLTCPDWDYCSECHLSASRSHPGHRFAPLYTAISEPLQSHEVHYGVFCDGPLCKDKPRSRYISGIRYKCSVCHDTDFCAKCEIHPSNMHNRTHPMVMLKTPVQNVSVSTVHEDRLSQATRNLGDRTRKSTSTQASAPIVQPQEMPIKEEAESVKELKPVVDREEKLATPEQAPTPTTEPEYQAFFLEDTISDGTVVKPNEVFQQKWKLYNPGPLTWPSGSNVRFVGGDSMFNVDTNHPSSLASFTAAMESNKLSEPLEAGKSAEFTVTLKAPRRLGCSISYWRMKLADGTPFGHRLWCDVLVRDDAADLDAPKETEKAPEPDTTEATNISESQMVFPKLDKESPAGSTHEAIVPHTAPSVTTRSEQDVLDDVASLTVDDVETETEAGFLTDEEYDILDASDQEFMDANSTHH